MLSGALGMLLFLLVILAAAWVMKLLNDAKRGMTTFQKVSNAIVSVLLAALIIMLIFPLMKK